MDVAKNRNTNETRNHRVRACLPIQLSGIKDIVISIHTPSSTITATVQFGNYRGDRGMDMRLRIPG